MAVCRRSLDDMTLLVNLGSFLAKLLLGALGRFSREDPRMQLEFVTVDVFTDRRFGGNPLAVVPQAEGLTTAQMQVIAKEFNLSETTFVLPAKDPGQTAKVRIFTPKFELPFAGRPNVGTAFVVARLRGLSGPLSFEEKAGLVSLDLLEDEGGEIVGARLMAPQPFNRGAEIRPDIVAAACGLDPEDIDTSRHAPCLAGCGAVLIFAERIGRAALERAGARSDVFSRYFPADAATGIHLYLRDGSDGIDIRARMFAPLYGIAEDPATGAANVALVGLLASLDLRPDLSLSLRIAQGVERGRPSLLDASAEKRDGMVTETRIGGRCVPVMCGTIQI
jgi:trans-2,3-dihydro-3-hydroxyanthranilate isomerase